MYVRVQVYPEAKKEQVIPVGVDRFTVSVKLPAVQNLANMRVKELLAKQYGVSVPMVRLISGHHSQRKIFSITTEK
jgi:uncharacterized protein YggU (UPF0235/DUF167 family)